GPAGHGDASCASSDGLAEGLTDLRKAACACAADQRNGSRTDALNAGATLEVRAARRACATDEKHVRDVDRLAAVECRDARLAAKAGREALAARSRIDAESPITGIVEGDLITRREGLITRAIYDRVGTDVSVSEDADVLANDRHRPGVRAARPNVDRATEQHI